MAEQDELETKEQEEIKKADDEKNLPLENDTDNDDGFNEEDYASDVTSENAKAFIDALSDQIADQGEGDDTVQEILKAIRPKYGI